MVIFHSYVNVYQRVGGKSSIYDFPAIPPSFFGGSSIAMFDDRRVMRLGSTHILNHFMHCLECISAFPWHNVIFSPTPKQFRPKN